MARHYDLKLQTWLDDELGVLVEYTAETGTETWLTDYDPYTNKAVFTERMNPQRAKELAAEAAIIREANKHKARGNTQQHYEQKAILPGVIQNQILREEMGPEDVDKWLDTEGKVWKTTDKSLTQAKRNAERKQAR